MNSGANRIRKISTRGILYLDPLDGGGLWYWGMDYTHGDLYEAEEVYRQGHPFRKNRLIFVRCRDGAVFEPIPPREGQYFGRPAFSDGQPVILSVDFPAGEIHLDRFDGDSGEVLPVVTLPLSAVEDCYNLIPFADPLMLTRQSSDDHFQIIWPEQSDFITGGTEAFSFREGDRLYFARWYEDPDYREEVVVRKLENGEILDTFPGALFDARNGERWLLV